MFFCKLTFLKIKRMLIFLPKAMAGTLLICLIMGVFAYGAGRLIYREQEVVKQQVGVVRPQDDRYIELALSMVKNIDSVNAICDFTYVDDEQTALDMLQGGKLNAVVIIPERFVQNVYHGLNVPLRVIMPNGSEIYASVFKNLADSGIGMLADVQAAVTASYYAAYDDTVLTEKNKDYNLYFLNIFLPREKLFKERNVSAAGTLLIGEYYGIMAVSVVMLLTGICLTGLLNGDEPLRRKGVSRLALFFADNISVLVFFTLLAAILFAVAYAAGFELVLSPLIFAALLLVSALVTVIYNIFSAWAGALCLFAFTLVSAYVGGALLPQAFLPENIASFMVYSPINVIFTCFSDTITESELNLPVYLTMLAVLYALAVLISLVREGAQR